MDLRHFFGVLRRRKLLVIVGTVIAVGAAFLAYTKLTAPVWESQSELLITQQNDPYGDAAQQVPLSGKSTSGSQPLELGGVTYMASLAPIYAAIANGDVVQAQARKIAPTSTLVASSVADPVSGAALPFVQLTVLDSSAGGAYKVAALASNTLEKYVSSQQAAGGVPTAQRVQLSTVQDGAQVKMVSGPSKTTALLLFVAILGCVIVLAYKLEKSGKSAGGELLGGPWKSEADGANVSAPDRAGSASRISSA